MEEKQNYIDCLKEPMTGWEAYRALEFVLMKWHCISHEEYVLWLSHSLQSDYALMVDFAAAVKEMLEEREKYGNSRLANSNEKLPVYKPCQCQKKE